MKAVAFDRVQPISSGSIRREADFAIHALRSKTRMQLVDALQGIALSVGLTRKLSMKHAR